MKKIITLILILFCTTAFTQDYKILHINAHWNERNTLKLPSKIEGVTVDFAWIEDQTKSLREKIQAVPVVIVYVEEEKEKRVVRKWSADISFKLNINAKEISEAIKQDKQKSHRRKTN
jgi:hypothetical protein